MQIVAKVIQSPLLEDLLGETARSMSEDDLLTYGTMVYNAYKRMEDINSSIPE